LIKNNHNQLLPNVKGFVIPIATLILNTLILSTRDNCFMVVL